MSEAPGRSARFCGLVLGTAVGDALGLPAEGISKRRARKMFRGRPRHRFLGRRGMVSDDTDHSVFVAQSLLSQPISSDRFSRRLGWCLRLWLLTLPAGVGFATLRSILRLCVGISPARSGVYSAGNGPAMRAAPIGAFFCESPDQLDAYLEASTRITHTDSRALTGARAVALLSAWVMREQPAERPSIDEFLSVLTVAATNEDREWAAAVDRIRAAHQRRLSVEEFAAELGQGDGVGGYVYHTVPVAVYAWYAHFGDFERTVSAVIECGGDTDTTGAIAGALAGVVVGEGGIPRAWLDGIVDWPRSRSVLKAIGGRLAEGDPKPGGSPVRYFWPGLLPRNLLFLIVVLLHGLRRLAPPY